MNCSVYCEHFENSQVSKCSKCQQMFLRKKNISLKDNNITLHIVAYHHFLFDMKIAIQIRSWRQCKDRIGISSKLDKELT